MKYTVNIAIQVVLEYDSDDTQNYPDIVFTGQQVEIIQTMVQEDFANLGEIEMIQFSNEPTNLVIESIEEIK